MEKDPFAILDRHNLKKTMPRVLILQALSDSPVPLTVAGLRKMVGKTKINEATFYRSVDALAEKGILNRLYLDGKETYYELSARPHHHHIVCTACKMIEDIEGCAVTESLTRITNKSSFSKITSHHLELFGVCKSCSRK